jgi:hypothetical protein
MSSLVLAPERKRHLVLAVWAAQPAGGVGQPVTLQPVGRLISTAPIVAVVPVFFTENS